jgi:hypothetical protein
VVLVVGAGAVIARIVYLTTRPPTPITASPTVNSAPVSSVTDSKTVAADIAVALPAGSKVRSQSLSSNRLSVHYEAPGGDGILIIDLETGRTISHVHLSGIR